MPDPGLATIYRDRMWTHQCGHACYHEVTTRDLHPGSIGFFDERARWKQILDLRELQPSAATPSSGRAGLAAKLSELSKLGEDLEFEDRPPMLWGPKLSDGTRGVEVDLKAGSTLPIAAAIPVEFGTVVQYKSDDSFGAVLLTGKEVYEAGIKFESPCTQWVKDNARKLLELRPEVKEHGIYVVRTVWSTEDVSLNAWMKRDKAVTVGFSAKVAGVAEVGPKGSFHHGGEDEGWIYYKADVSCDRIRRGTEADAGQNDKERIVCFADCLHFEFNIFVSHQGALHTIIEG
jgi:hypothetical protein